MSEWTKEMEELADEIARLPPEGRLNVGGFEHRKDLVRRAIQAGIELGAQREREACIEAVTHWFRRWNHFALTQPLIDDLTTFIRTMRKEGSL